MERNRKKFLAEMEGNYMVRIFLSCGKVGTSPVAPYLMNLCRPKTRERRVRSSAQAMA